MPISHHPLLPILALLACLLPGRVVAGPIAAGDVPPDAQWVAHLDVRGMLESSLGEFLLAQGNAGQLEEGRALIRQSAGFDPMTDLESLTVYGHTDQPDAAVAVLRGAFDPDMLLALVQGPEDGDFEHGSHTVHQWSQAPENADDDGRRFAAFVDDALIAARTRAAVEGALDRMDAAASPDDTQVNPLLERQPEAAFLWVAARDLPADREVGSDPVAQQLRHVTGGVMSLGDVGDGAAADETRMMIRLDATDATKANQMRQVLGGISAWARFLQGSAKPGDQLDAWVPLGAAAQITGEDEIVQLTLQMPTSQMVQRIQTMIEEHQANQRSAAE